MSKICKNCGRKLKDTAKFCGRCGIKLDDDKSQDNTANQDNENKIDETNLNESILALVQSAIAQQQTNNNGLKINQQLFNDEQKEKAKQYANMMKDKGAGLVDDVKNYKTLSAKKKRNLLIIGTIAVVILAVLLFFIFNIGGGASDKVVSEASLSIAEQDYGYKLELTDYEIVEHFTTNTEVPLTGKKLKAKVYYVIIEADVKDTNGDTAKSVKYAVCCADPKKKDGVATYNEFSTATNCTDMEDSEIKELIKTNSAKLR